jgi:hypothetical protein
LIERIIEIGKYNGMEINMEKTKVMRISRQPSPKPIMVDKIIWRMWNILTVCVV